MKKFIVVGNKGGSISLKSWHEILTKLKNLDKKIDDIPKYAGERFRFLHIYESDIKFGEFDINCENILTIKEFSESLDVN